MFYVQSKYDTWQQKAILGLQCPITKCNATTKAAFVAYGRLLAQAVMKLPARHGAWVTNCPEHCQVGRSQWEGETVGGVSMKAAFLAWYHGVTTPAPPANYRYVPTCDGGPCGTDVCV